MTEQRQCLHFFNKLAHQPCTSFSRQQTNREQGVNNSHILGHKRDAFRTSATSLKFRLFFLILTNLTVEKISQVLKHPLPNQKFIHPSYKMNIQHISQHISQHVSSTSSEIQ